MEELLISEEAPHRLHCYRDADVQCTNGDRSVVTVTLQSDLGT